MVPYYLLSDILVVQHNVTVHLAIIVAVHHHVLILEHQILRLGVVLMHYVILLLML
jgi:hypothetical protein